jgi:hypothetical protein
MSAQHKVIFVLIDMWNSYYTPSFEHACLKNYY